MMCGVKKISTSFLVFVVRVFLKIIHAQDENYRITAVKAEFLPTVMMRGVKKMSTSFLILEVLMFLKRRLPNQGMSPNTGTFVVVTTFWSVIKPAMTKVLPSSTITFVSASWLLVSVNGLFWTVIVA